MLFLEEQTENQEQTGVGKEVRPAEVNEVTGPEPPEFAGGHGLALVEQGSAPAGRQMDEERGGREDQKSPRRAAGEEIADGARSVQARRVNSSRAAPTSSKAARNHALGAPPPPPPPEDGGGGAALTVSVAVLLVTLPTALVTTQ